MSKYRCEYCWRPRNPEISPNGEHNEKCPSIDGSINLFEQGRNQYDDDRWEGEVMSDRQLAHGGYPVEFIYGYRVARAWMDQLVDEAAENRELDSWIER